MTYFNHFGCVLHCEAQMGERFEKGHHRAANPAADVDDECLGGQRRPREPWAFISLSAHTLQIQNHWDHLEELPRLAVYSL